MKLKDVIERHTTVQGLSGKIGCLPRCPACAQRKLVEWLKSHDVVEDSIMVDSKCLLIGSEDWQALKKALGMEG